MGCDPVRRGHRDHATVCRRPDPLAEMVTAVTYQIPLTGQQAETLRAMRDAYYAVQDELTAAINLENYEGDPVDSKLYYARDDQAVEIANFVTALMDEAASPTTEEQSHAN